MPETIVGSVGVQLVPSAKGFAEKARAQLRGLKADVEVDADTTKANEKIDETARPRKTKIKTEADTALASARIAALSTQVDQFAAKQAQAQLSVGDLKGYARAEAELRTLKRQLGSLDAHIEADANTSKAEAELDHAARTRTARINAKVDHMPKGLGLLGTSLVALGPTLVPTIAAVGGLTAALSAPLAAAGAGGTVYGFLAGKAAKQTEKQKKQIDDLAKKVQQARSGLATANASAARSQANSVASAQRSASLSLTTAQQSAQKSIASAKQSLAASVASAQRSMASATTAAGRASAQQRIDAARTSAQHRIAAAQQSLAYRKNSIAQGLANRQASAAASATAAQAAAQAKLTDAQKAYRSALSALTPAQKKFLDAQDTLKGDFQTFLAKNGGSVLGPLTQGMGLLDDLLPKTAPLIDAVSGSVSGLLREVDGWANSKGAKGLSDFLTTWSGRSITGLGHILGNVATGVGSMVKAAAPMGGSLLDSIEGWSRGFRDIGQSKGFQSFLDYVHREGPVVARTFGDIAGATGHIAHALAPIGHVGLVALDGLANGVKKIPTGVLTKAAGSLALILVSIKGIRAAKGAFSALSKIPKLGGLLGGSGGLGGGVLGKIGKGVVPVYVTNKGFGVPEGGKPGGVPFGGTSGIPKGEPIPKMPGGIGPLIAIGGLTFGAAGNEVRNDLLAPNDPRVRAAQAKQAAKAAREAARDAARSQSTLTDLLLAPAMKLGKVYASLPKQVKTAIATPGAVESMNDVKQLQKQYDLTAKQIKTVVRLSGVRESAAALKSYTDMLERLNGKVARTFLQQVVRQPIAGGGHPLVPRASGGPIEAGRRYLVGEQGPEMFVSRLPGRIIPAQQTAQVMSTVAARPGLGTEIRGTLRLDRDGVAYIHGVVRQEIAAASAQQVHADRLAALGALE